MLRLSFSSVTSRSVRCVLLVLIVFCISCADAKRSSKRASPQAHGDREADKADEINAPALNRVAEEDESLPSHQLPSAPKRKRQPSGVRTQSAAATSKQEVKRQEVKRERNSAPKTPKKRSRDDETRARTAGAPEMARVTRSSGNGRIEKPLRDASAVDTLSSSRVGVASNDFDEEDTSTSTATHHPVSAFTAGSSDRETRENAVQEDNTEGEPVTLSSPRPSPSPSPSRMPSSRPSEPYVDPATKELLEQYFQNAEGLHKLVYTDSDLNSWPSLTTAEQKRFENKYELVYGEIKLRSLQRVLEAAEVKEGETFFDMGMGDGKVVLGAYLLGKFARVRGIEFVPSRFERSCLMLEVWESFSNASSIHQKTKEFLQLQVEAKADPSDEKRQTELAEAQQRLKFYELAYEKAQTHGVLELAWGDARNLTEFNTDVLYMCNTCFRDEFMSNVMDKIQMMKKGSRIIALHSLPSQHPAYSELEEMTVLHLAMTWTSSTEVHIYRKVTDPPAPESAPDSVKRAVAHARQSKTPLAKCVFDNRKDRRMSINFDPATYNPALRSDDEGEQKSKETVLPVVEEQKKSDTSASSTTTARTNDADYDDNYNSWPDSDAPSVSSRQSIPPPPPPCRSGVRDLAFLTIGVLSGFFLPILAHRFTIGRKTA